MKKVSKIQMTLIMIFGHTVGLIFLGIALDEYGKNSALYAILALGTFFIVWYLFVEWKKKHKTIQTKNNKVLIIDSKKTFSVKQAVNFAWKKFWSRWKFYVGVVLASILISMIIGGIDSLVEDITILNARVSIVSIIVQILISLGLITVLLNSARERTVAWSDMWVNKERFLQFFAVSILYQVIVFIGFILLIIPGIYLALRYQYAQLIIIDDREISIGKAFKRSAQMTKNIKWRLLWLWVVSAGIGILGLVALGVGIFAAIPVAALAQVFVYVYIRKTYHSDFVGEAHDKIVEVESLESTEE